MKKLLITVLLFISCYAAFSQSVQTYRPINAYYRGSESDWEWRNMDIDYTEMPVIKIYYNNNKDALSKVDRVTISNKWEDDFKFPYKGTIDGSGVLFEVIDNKGKKNKVFFDFENYDNGYFDLIFKYYNLEYAYRLPTTN